MIVRSHSSGETRSTAVYSACGRYRYALTRVWDAAAPKLLVVMLNPSTATEERNDPTIERVERRARRLGFGAFRVTNLFALRATDPKALYAHPDPVGPDNDAAMAEAVAWADRVLCAWGVHGALLHRDVEAAATLQNGGKPLFHLGLTKAGAPRHPLYVSYAQAPQPWRP
ncbi:DUF1643 domain-containing protein [Frigidibacter sp. ROC022]|uniref:DUF1643 domain-containing protein n=1 Tax=Frigidibacter sp. ROC022 TaxID=2971796 RepID=UPI00215A4DDF|nr:DUF1643 domain-containing protein [Frigidibacter sp. ROC022]MCR8725908.1 DUF1643 domain-containing protein [Frigidibacter sp. ROC022]